MFDARPLPMIGGIFVYDGDATSAGAIKASGQVTGFSALTSIIYYNETCGEYRTKASGPYHAFRSDPMNRINGAYGARTRNLCRDRAAL
jgi:hypothetical protein